MEYWDSRSSARAESIVEAVGIKEGSDRSQNTAAMSHASATLETMGRQFALGVVVWLVACGGGEGDTTDAAVDAAARPDVLLPAPVLDCDRGECPACASGTECGEGGPHIEGTCCVLGDSLIEVGRGTGAEVVDLEVNDRYAILCGGFGATVNDISKPDDVSFIGTVGRRCQRVAFGPMLASGAQVFYLAHHGDTWVASPSLGTYSIDAAGIVQELDFIADANTLFEGIVYHAGFLYVAAHAGGVRVYSINDQGIPVLVTVVGGFDNAWKVDAQGDHLYVADADGGLHVLDISTPVDAGIIQSIATTALARDVDVHGPRVYVALGGGGVDVFDASVPSLLTPLRTLDTKGSAQAVSANDTLLTVANWDNVLVFEASSLQLLAVEELSGYPDFEQDLGVSLVDNHLYVGEWEGLHVLEYRQGHVAPALDTDEDLLQFAPTEGDSRAVVLRNRGHVPLFVTDVRVPGASFSVNQNSFQIAPGKADVFEVTFQPPAPEESVSQLVVYTNDPDASEFIIPISTRETTRLNIGDRLTADFGFLHASGSIEGLEGHVIVLAYFALF